ncbi:hypothetical protein BGX24_003075 [Mortierella sp. AD032]|nr:hypothetical protein BGX24_003075 [Mortierella sp. AD032]
MATKRNHALKRQQYGTPLPLPALQQLPQTLPPVTTPRSTVPADPARAIWTLPLSPIFAIIRLLYYQWDAKNLPSRSLIQGYFHPSGASVWIHESKDIEVLFRQGFFGKGTLSRSEATWTVRTTEGFQGKLVDTYILRVTLRVALRVAPNDLLKNATVGPFGFYSPEDLPWKTVAGLSAAG